MKIVYVKLNGDNRVIRYDSNKIEDSIQVEVEDDMLVDGRLLSCYYVDNELNFNKNEYDEKISRREQLLSLAQKRKEDEIKLQKIELRHRLAPLSDDEAYEVFSLLPVWSIGDKYIVNDRITYGDDIYRVKKDVINATLIPDKDITTYEKIGR